MAGVQCDISPSVIQQVLERKGLSLDVLAGKIGVKKNEKGLESLKRGSLYLTHVQKLAEVAKVPFGFLFLDSLPEMPKPDLPDFRNTKDREPLSDDFYEVYRDIERKIEWYSEYLTRNEMKKPLDFVGRYADINFTKDDVYAVAKDIKNTLKISEKSEKAIKQPYKEEYLKKLVGTAEDVGILVFRNGIVNASTTKPLNVKEFRGFAVADKYIPYIFINTKDSKSAQLFTLFHELAHIWVGASGLSNMEYPMDVVVERFCNNVAAEILMPERLFKSLWDEQLDAQDNIKKLSEHFKTSELSVAVQANRLCFVGKDVIDAVRREMEEALKQKEAGQKQKEKKGGPPPKNTVPVRNSRRLTKALLFDTMNQHTLLTEASRLLRIPVRSIPLLAEEIK